MVRNQNTAAAVTARLTNASNYTGSHKERFAADGKGKGLAGREDLVKSTGSTSSASRDNTVSNTNINKASKPVVKEKTSEETYGVTARKVMLYQYAEKNHAGEKLVLTKQKFPSMKHVNEFAIKMIPTGKAKLILDQNLKEVTSLDELVDGQKYLAITTFDRKSLDEAKIPVGFRA
ncbi:hypothetical protein BJ742DRAFT_808218 [Cladochytrium replicatum]|nr:hypothetical protein BJ742DRAFT_808218 [Cladochytrium replicatum]